MTESDKQVIRDALSQMKWEAQSITAQQLYCKAIAILDADKPKERVPDDARLVICNHYMTIVCEDRLVKDDETDSGERCPVCKKSDALQDIDADKPETPAGDPYNGWRMVHDGVGLSIAARDDTWEISACGRREGPYKHYRVEPLDGTIAPLGADKPNVPLALLMECSSGDADEEWCRDRAELMGYEVTE
jgi:hypothetical protein